MARDTQILDHSTSLPTPSPEDETSASGETRLENPAFEDLLPALEDLREHFATLDAEREEALHLKDELAAQVARLRKESDQLKVRLDELEALLGKARGEAQRLGQENQELKRRHQTLLESTSWRLTAPLRALLDRLRS